MGDEDFDSRVMQGLSVCGAGAFSHQNSETPIHLVEGVIDFLQRLIGTELMVLGETSVPYAQYCPLVMENLGTPFLEQPEPQGGVNSAPTAGEEVHIEVKTTTGPAKAPFYMSASEVA